MFPELLSDELVSRIHPLPNRMRVSGRTGVTCRQWVDGWNFTRHILPLSSSVRTVPVSYVDSASWGTTPSAVRTVTHSPTLYLKPNCEDGDVNDIRLGNCYANMAGVLSRAGEVAGRGIVVRRHRAIYF